MEKEKKPVTPTGCADQAKSHPSDAMQDALIRTMAELVDRHDESMEGHVERTQQGIKILLDEMEKHNVYQDEIKKLIFL
uniref:Uncharacterized protein n=1 Tax=uncultured bacterium contig00049 TaxID=1181534 RepID=A0A806JYQ4_9BACT|nr:hypothetical protein [uncultured bacterium contig00049]